MEKLQAMYDRIDPSDIHIINVDVKTNNRAKLSVHGNGTVSEKVCYYNVSYSHKDVNSLMSVQTEYNSKEGSYGWYDADWQVWSTSLMECVRRSIAWDLDYQETMEGSN